MTEITPPPMVTRYIDDGHYLKLASVRMVDNLTFSYSSNCLVGKYKDKPIMGRTYPEADTYEDFIPIMNRFMYKFLDDLSAHVFNNIILPSVRGGHD